ncbi:MAG TPA: class I SAM-dependent methyltransferase [Gemmatimonadales bacterium]|nr:class I SAM-dependent methyltransferase [Gemmatimonadales bacterium]
MIREWIRTAAIAARNAALGSNLASLALITRPRQLVGYGSEALFLLDAMQQRRSLPERNVVDAIPGAPREVEIRLTGRGDAMWLGSVGSYHADLLGLLILCRVLEPRVVFEIGTFHGWSALHFALNTAADAEVFTLDLPPGSSEPKLKTTVVDRAFVREGSAVQRYAFSGSDLASKIRTLRGDSATFDFSPWHERVDLFFVDGAHSYEYVRSDTEHALRCLRPGGALAWHDFGRLGVNGVRQYLIELAASGLKINVVPGGSLAYAVDVNSSRLTAVP